MLRRQLLDDGDSCWCPRAREGAGPRPGEGAPAGEKAMKAKRVHMKHACALLAAVVMAALPLTAQSGLSQATQYGAAKGWKVPRLADGRPDLQGVWGNNGVTPMTRPPQWE